MSRRVFWIVLDRAGIGGAPDAADFGDSGADTFGTCYKSGELDVPNMAKMGLYNIEGTSFYDPKEEIDGCFCRMHEKSRGKDTTVGHWEMAGMVSPKPLPTYYEGFPQEILDKLSEATGRGIVCNKTYSGTDVIRDYGKHHVETGDLIVYTSADSVLQIAAHEDKVPVDKLYSYCEKVRELLQGEHGVGRVIARPFIGTSGKYVRTSNRHDFSIKPPKDTMLNKLQDKGYETLAVGKIFDIFAGQGISDYVRTTSNEDGINKTLEMMDRDFEGICFVNLVDYDMLYGHRRDRDGYAKALSYFDERLPEILGKMRSEDILMITADHGCDPDFKGTDHTRECVPLLMYGTPIPSNTNLGTKDSFTYVADTVMEYFDIV